MCVYVLLCWQRTWCIVVMCGRGNTYLCYIISLYILKNSTKKNITEAIKHVFHLAAFRGSVSVVWWAAEHLIALRQWWRRNTPPSTESLSLFKELWGGVTADVSGGWRVTGHGHSLVACWSDVHLYLWMAKVFLQGCNLTMRMSLDNS